MSLRSSAVDFSCFRGRCGGLPSEGTLEGLEGVLKALSDGGRLRLLWCLRCGPTCVHELASCCGMSLALASHHLRILKVAGVVSSCRRGRHVYYSISPGRIGELLEGVFRLLGEEGGTS